MAFTAVPWLRKASAKSFVRAGLLSSGRSLPWESEDFLLHHWQRQLKGDWCHAASRRADSGFDNAGGPSGQGEAVPWLDLGLPHWEPGHSERRLLLHNRKDQKVKTISSREEGGRQWSLPGTGEHRCFQGET